MSSKPNQSHVIDVHVILEKSGEILLLKRRDGKHPEFDSLWHLPSGKLEVGESIKAGAAREVLEETAVTVNEKDLELVCTVYASASGPTPRVGFFFICHKWQGEPKNTEPDKCYELDWHQIDQVPSNTVAYTREGIVAWLSQTNYIET